MRTGTVAACLLATLWLMVRYLSLLLGELRLPLTSRLAVWSDLETPLTRRVHRTLHRLEPMPRWTLGWVTLVAPQRLAERFLGIPSLLTGVEAVRLAASGVRLNPWSPPPTGGIRDHLDLLRIAIPAARVSRATGVPLSAQALVGEPPEPFIAEVLAGAGVAGILPRDAVATRPCWGSADYASPQPTEYSEMVSGGPKLP